MLAFLRRSAIALAWAYPAGLLLVLLAFRWLGEDWWVTAATLYLPRLGFGLPLLVLLPAVLLLRAFRVLWALGLAAILLAWPLMGFSLSLSWPRPRREPTTFRVLSLNADSCAFGSATVAAAILEYEPDLVLLQEVHSGRDQLEAALRGHYPSVHASTQFIAASRFPILETSDPDQHAILGPERSARYMRYLLDTPLGRITAFNIHPASPRAGLNEIRGPGGFRHELRSGRAFSRHAAPEVAALAKLRRDEVAAVVRDAADERHRYGPRPSSE